jgi:uncharacterized membrane protein HdeD (DUF308 family)
MTLVRGVIWILFGIFVISQPALSLVTLTLLFGIFALADGIGNVVSAIGGRRSIAFGVFLMARPGEGALSVLWLIGGCAVALGVILIGRAVKVRGFVRRSVTAG